MPIEEIHGVAALNEILLAESRGVVVDFWGTWCQPCRTLRPHLESLAETNADAWRFVAVHAEENTDLVERFDVQSTPTLIYLRGGEELHRSAGAITPTGVAEALEAVS
jgi:thioredoxin